MTHKRRAELCECGDQRRSHRGLADACLIPGCPCEAFARASDRQAAIALSHAAAAEAVDGDPLGGETLQGIVDGSA